MSRARLVVSILLVASCSICAPVVRAQLPQASDTTSPPTPGVGHDYLGGALDTVNPANGSVSIRIPLRVSAGRRLTIPLSIAYDSSGAFYYGLPSGGSGSPGYMTITNVPFSQGGWSYTFPLLTNASETWMQQYSNGKNYTCVETANYVLQDATGNRHNMGLVGLKTPVGGNCGSAITTGGEGPILATLSGTSLLTTSVTDGNGTAYAFPAVGYHANYLVPTSITDRNGNTVSISSTLSSASVTDTVGRSAVSVGTFGANPDSINVAGLGSPYQVSWTTASASFTIGQTNLNPGISQNCPTSVTGSASVISQIVLPNGQKLTFTYDPTYGMLSKMTYPTGGYVRYVWGLNSQAEAGIWASGLASWNCRYDFPAVTDRYVSFDGTTEVLHQHYAYTTSWSGSSANYASKSTTLTTYDLVRNANFRTIYTYAGVSSPCVPDQNPNTAGCLGNPTAQIPLEQTIQYYGTGANLLRTVTKSWFNSNTRTLGSELTTLDNGQSTLTVYCYNSSELETEHDDYDFGNAAPALPSCAAGVPSGTAAGPLLRRTVTTYSPSTTMSNYNVIDEPSKVQVYDSTGSNLAGETDYTYDNPVGATTSGIVQHSGGCNCGNLTAAARWLNSSSSTLTTNYTNDDTGQRLSMTDPRGNQTTYSYADDYSSGTPPGSTNAFLTQITHPNTGVGHIEKFSYAYATGELTGSTDQNNQVTNYEYNDSLARLTEADFPDGGQVATSYNDVPPVSIGSATKINSSTNLITTSIFDGLGHVTQTQLNSDPDGATYTDKTYDALGHVYCVSNPYRVSNPSNLGNFGFTDGITTTVYDALGRVTAVQPPDYWTATSPGGPTCPSLTTQTTPANPTNFVSTSYSGNCTTVTDEAGKARKSCSDGLGRLTQVTEDPGGLGYVTNYGYDALDNLTSVVQNGSRQRTFVYDSLSQLTSATNPESGTITYSYDANGNLTSKTSPAPNQTGSATVTANYSYDALNRLTQKSFSDGTTPAVKYGYDGIALTGCSVAPPTLADSNPIGRRTAMCDGAGAESWSHDSMGRILSDNRTTSGITKTVPYAYNLDGSLASLTYRQDRNPEPISYTPGGAGRPISAGNSSFGLAYSVHYAPNGSLCSLYSSWGQTFEHNYTFNNRLQVIDIQDWDQSWYAYDYGSSPPPCTAIADSYEEQLHLTYSYTDVSGHNNGDVQRINNNRDMARTQLFTYDSLNRLATAETLHQNQPWWQGDSPTAECWGEQFNYDPWGNLTGISPVSSAYTGCTQENWSMTATTKNQLQDTNNDYVYDAAGNLIQPGPLGGPYVFDAENHLTSAGGMAYLYDGDGKRVGKAPAATPTQPNYLYWYGTGSQILEETDGAGNYLYTDAYFNGMLLARGESDNWVDHFFADALGNVREVYGDGDPDGGYSDYYPFGGERPIPTCCPNNSGGVNVPFKFTGKERDSESGLDNFLSRYMSSSLGRFMRPDPAQFAGFENKDDPQAWNGYAYGRNNPLLYTDPDGLNHLVCDKDGKNCADLSDPQYDQFRKDNPNLRVTPSGDIYTQNENGTETKTGHESYYNEHALDSLINAGRTAQIGVNYAMLVTAPNYLLIGGAHFFLAGSSFSTFGSISVLTNQAAGRIIGWGVGQTAAGVEATRELTQNLTPERVQEMINEGLNMPTVQNLLNQYGRAIAEGGAKLGNQQLQPRFELMQKIRDMWPAK